MTSLELLSCILLIFISGYVAAAEIALFSLSRFQLRSLKENFRPIYRKIKHLLGDPGGLLITILVDNEVLNITISGLITKAIARRNYAFPIGGETVPEWILETFLGILVSAPIILILCEITPKIIALRINQIVAPLTVGPLTMVYQLLKPIRYILKNVILVFSRQPKHLTQKLTSQGDHPHAHDKDSSADPILKESDFLLMVEEGHKKGAIQENEMELIKNVFDLDNTTVSEISTPLFKMLTLPMSTTLKDALIAIRNQRYSRIPILGSNRKDVVGILYSKDLLRAKLHKESDDITVTAWMRKPFFINSHMKLNTLFRQFKAHKTHMAIIKNAQDEVMGVVTMSDVLDALFEDLYENQDMSTTRSAP